MTDLLSSHVTGRQGEPPLSFADFKDEVLKLSNDGELTQEGLNYLICRTEVANDVAREWVGSQELTINRPEL
ncbi:MAG: hypothetical protein AAFV29_06615 [Myxococcota bacterium]